jgi:hypothetical protein
VSVIFTSILGGLPATEVSAMKTIENNKNNVRKTPAEFRDFKKVGSGSVPGEKRVAVEHKQPVKNPEVDAPRKLKL